MRKGVRMSEATKETCSKSIRLLYKKDPVYRERLSKSKIKLFDNNYELPKKNQALSKKYYQTHAEAREEQSRRMKEYLSKPGNRAFVESSSKPRPVICVETGVIYPSQRAAEKATGFSNVHKVCCGLAHTCGGYHWKNA